MALYTGNINNVTPTTILDSIKSVMIDQLGFTLISDSGTGLLREVKFNLTGYNHICSFTFNNSSVSLYVRIYKTDGLSLLHSGTAFNGNNRAYLTDYKAVNFNDNKVLFLHNTNANYYRSSFIFCSSGNHKHIIPTVSSTTTNANHYIISATSDDTAAFSGYRMTSDQKTVDGKDILSPMILPTSVVDSLLCDSSVLDVKVCESAGGAVGSLYTAGGSKYIICYIPYSGAEPWMLVRYE